MPAEPTKSFELSLPTGGVDRSTPIAKQPPATCPETLNVRGTPPLSDRRSIGKRPGFRRAFTTALGAGGTGVVQVERSATPAETTDGILTVRIDDMGQYGTTNSLAAVGSGYVAAVMDAASSSPTIRACTDDQLKTYSSAGLAQRHLQVFGPSAVGDVGKDLLVMSAFPCNVDFKVTMTAAPGCRLEGGADDNQRWNPTQLGPCVRVADDLSSGVCAYLEYVGFGQDVRLKMFQWGTSGFLQIGQSSVFTLRGFIDPTDVDDADLRPDLEIRLYEDKVNARLVATAQWQQALAAGGNLDITLSVATTALATQTRAGFIFRTSTMGYTSYSQANFVRFVRYLSYSRRQPYEWPSIYRNIAYEDTSGGVNSLDSITASNALLTASSPVLRVGPTTYGSIQNWPTSDTANDYIEATTNYSNTTQQYLQIYMTSPGSATWALRCYYRSIATGSDQINPVFNCNAAHHNLIRFEPTRTIGTNNNAMGTSDYSAIIMRVTYDNAGRATAVIQTESFAGARPVFSLNYPVEWSYESGTVYIRQNGITLYSYNVTGDAQWTGAIASTTYGDYIGADISTGDGATVSQAHGWEIINKSPTLTAATPTARYIVGISSNASAATGIKRGTFGGTTLTAFAGLGLTGDEPCIATQGGSAWCVDGVASRQLDPYNLTANPWAGVSGTDLDRCTTVAAWRGRLVIGGPGPQWYMSAVLQPTNFNFGESVTVATRAFTGANADIGQPGDNIVALASFEKDYLWHLCARSLWVMVGDPGTGGQLEEASQGIGCLGRRAWCYDARGNLYFLGSNGLNVIPRKETRHTPVSGARLKRDLDRIDTSLNKLQLVYSAFDDIIFIYITPRDGSQGYHWIYEVGNNAFHGEQYPTRFGPGGVCSINGETDEDRRILIVGSDGYIRRFGDDLYDDDGDEITSRVRMATVQAPTGDRMRATQIEAVGADGSGPLNWYLLGADSADEVAALPTSAARASGIWGAGRQGATSIAVRAQSLQLVLEQISRDETWSLSSIEMAARSAGRGR